MVIQQIMRTCRHKPAGPERTLIGFPCSKIPHPANRLLRRISPNHLVIRKSGHLAGVLVKKRRGSLAPVGEQERWLLDTFY